MSNSFINSAAIVSSSPQIVEMLQSCFKHREHIDVISSAEDVELLSIELPDLIIIDFTDWGLAFSVVDRISDDPWLHFQNIITIVSSYDVSYQSSHNGINTLAKISKFDIQKSLPVVLDIVRKNHRLIFHRGYETAIVQNVTGGIQIGNTLLEVETVVNLTCSYLFNANKIDDSRKNRLKTALTELFVNSLEHGNCGIGHDEKFQWLSSDKPIQELIAQKLEDPQIAGRQIKFNYSITSDYSEFWIEDEGEGFNWNDYDDDHRDETYTSHNGRGITMAKVSASLIEYQGDGNKVRCMIEHQELKSNTCPVVFSNISPEIVSEGSIILRQGDQSNYLYFIERGEYLVTVNEKPVSVLTPDDIFMGEMSFLLNGKRSASIIALSEGAILRISKRDFVSVIREYPHYSLFLSRLLARRLSKSTQ